MLSKYSIGIGDRFGCQAEAQIRAISRFQNETGMVVTPVWNKSHREHTIIHSTPEETSESVHAAIRKSGFKGSWYLDADHINRGNVDGFIPYCNFFTIDIADYIGKPADIAEINKFTDQFKSYEGVFTLPGQGAITEISRADLLAIGQKYLFAIRQAGEIYRYIREQKSGQAFITEISMDEVDTPQSPTELFFILGGLAAEGIPADTIAPKFSGRFNKGVDYVGDVSRFAAEFENDLLVVGKACEAFGLPAKLKLSVHSGSDKFSIYSEIGRLIKKHQAGLHLKTAGTTWLEELIGLALAGDEALELAKSIYAKAFARRDELCSPYATVIDITPTKLPHPDEVAKWSGLQYAAALRHNPSESAYNPHLRQLLHVGYKIAAEYCNVYLNLVQRHAAIVGQQVETNIYERHLTRVFMNNE